MKNRTLTAALFAIAGILVILIPTVLFPVCDASEMRMSCYYTKNALIGVGAVIALLGAVSYIFTSDEARKAVSLAEFLNALLVLALPLKLTGFCKMPEMSCRAATLPALIVISVLLIAGAAGNFVYLTLKEKR